MLSRYQIKLRLPFGTQAQVAETCRVSRGLVSGVVSGRHRNREVQRALWMRMVEPSSRKPTSAVRSLVEVFGPPVPVKMRAERAA